MKRILFKVLLSMLLLALVLVAAGFVILDRGAWIASRRLSTALRGARSVTLTEFTHATIIARSTATPDETSRLQRAASVWVVLSCRRPLCARIAEKLVFNRLSYDVQM